jgi:hypothetical protein
VRIAELARNTFISATTEGPTMPSSDKPWRR